MHHLRFTVIKVVVGAAEKHCSFRWMAGGAFLSSVDAGLWQRGIGRNSGGEWDHNNNARKQTPKRERGKLVGGAGGVAARILRADLHVEPIQGLCPLSFWWY